MIRKIIFLTSILISILSYSFREFTDKPDEISNVKKSFTIDYKKLDANNISTWFRNNGNFNRDPFTGNSGFEFPKGSGKFVRYASGFWIGCTVGNDTLTAVAEYDYDYKPGYVDNNGNPQGQNDPLYRIYRIERGDTTSPDYLNWPVNQGAYVNSQGNPFFLGNQTMFYSYTDAYPHSSNASSDSSLRVQILQTNWCYTTQTLQSVLFSEFKIINRSNSVWNNAYLAIWTDDDIGWGSADKVGCDTLRNMQYTYSSNGNNPPYGITPPAVGTRILRSPVIYTGNVNDTVKFYDPPGSQNLRIKIGYKFKGVSIYHAYNNTNPQPSDPDNNTETYRALRGLWNDGSAWIDPSSGQPTTKPFSGDPVTGLGWLMPSEGNRKSLISCGPVSMNPNDTQSIIIAQVAGKGSTNYYQSILLMRAYSDFAQSIYDQNFQSVLAVNNITTETPARVSLSQNYPNPFNPVTNLEFGISKLGFVSLKIYDALGNEIKTLVNEMKTPGTYRVDFDGSGLSSGIYFYKLRTDDFSETKRMILLK